MTVTTTVAGTGSYLPAETLTNNQLANRLGIDEQWILDKTGIKERRVAAAGEVTSDLAAKAAEQALADADVAASDVDVLIVATVTPDQTIPATACFVQSKIGAVGASAFDIAAGCSGFVFALEMAHDILVANPRRDTALVIGAEVFSRVMDYSDKRTCVIFGDGAGAVLLRKTDSGPGIVTTYTTSDGSNADLAYIEAGGARIPTSVETVASAQHYVRMHGREIRTIVVEELPKLVSTLLNQANISIDQIGLIVPHQVNGVMLDQWPEILGIPSQLIYRTVSWSGNTGAASIPVALDDAARKAKFAKGDLAMFVTFGAGLTLGGAIIKW